jgi:molecular chaperone DnaK
MTTGNRAFVVGCARYEDPDIADLRYADADARRFAEVLRSVCGFAEDEVVLLHDGQQDPRLQPTRANLLREVSRSSRVPHVADEGLTVFFYSGHGFRSATATGDYLIPRDAVMTALEDSSLRFATLIEHLQAWRSKHVLLFLDACRAAVAGGRAAASDQLASVDVNALCPSGMVTFCSCEPGRASYEADVYEAGIFTAGICEALSDQGRCKTIYELDGYLTRIVPEMSARSHKPVQRPHSRVEPLGIQKLEIVSAAKRNQWRAETPIGEERRAAAVAPAGKGLVRRQDPLCAVDFGTSYSALAIEEGRSFHPVPSADGRHFVPSVLNVQPDLTYTVGFPALEADRYRPEGTIRHVKRSLASGRSHEIGGRSIDPELAASLILRSLRTNAEQFLGRRVTKCLAAYPANFSTAQRNSLTRAFELAGFEVVRLVGEPNAAALLVQTVLAAHEELPREEGWALVVDLGGGTFDVALVPYGDTGGRDPRASDLVVEIAAVGGSNSLGGLDYDEAVAGYIRHHVASDHGADARVLASLEPQIIREAERAKRALGSRDETAVLLQDAGLSGAGAGDIEVPFDRALFRALVADLDGRVERTIRRVLGSVREARGLNEDAVRARIDFVLLTGQGSKVFTVREAIDRLGLDVPMVSELQESAVVRGLGQQTGVLNGERKDLLLLDVMHQALGIRCAGQDGDLPVLSRDPAANTRFLQIVRSGQVIPTARLRRVLVTGGQQPLRLDVTEVTGVTAEPERVALIDIVTGQDEALLDVALDIDANRTVVLAVQEVDRESGAPRAGGWAAAYQLTNPHLEAVLAESAVDDRTRFEWVPLPRVPIQKLATDLI